MDRFIRKRPARTLAHHGSDLEPPVKKERPTTCNANFKKLVAPDQHGELLPEFLKSCMRKLSNDGKKNLHANVMDRAFTMSSACTGSGMAEVCHTVVHSLLNRPSHAAFACEKVKYNIEFYQAAVEPHLASPSCCFEDMASLPSGAADCCTHGRLCTIARDVDLHACGFSCKDFSRLKSNAGMDRSKILENGAGSSGLTFQSLIGHIRASRPRTLILENVDSMENHDGEDDSDVEGNNFGSNINFLYASFEKNGYAVAHDKFNTVDFLLPQRRRRLYFVAICVDRLGISLMHGKELARGILDLARSFAAPALSLERFIFPNTDDFVANELKRLQQIRDGDDTDTGKERSWPNLHREIFKAAGLTWTHMATPPELANNPWLQTLPRRNREVLIYNMIRHAGREEKQLVTVDLSQP